MRVIVFLFDDFKEQNGEAGFKKIKFSQGNDVLCILLHRNSPAMMPEDKAFLESLNVNLNYMYLNQSGKDDFQNEANLSLNNYLENARKPDVFIIGKGLEDFYSDKLSTLLNRANSVAYNSVFRLSRPERKYTKKSYIEEKNKQAYEQTNISDFDQMTDRFLGNNIPDDKTQTQRKESQKTEPQKVEHDKNTEKAEPGSGNENTGTNIKREEKPSDNGNVQSDKLTPERLKASRKKIFSTPTDYGKAPVKEDKNVALEDAKALLSRELIKRFIDNFNRINKKSEPLTIEKSFVLLECLIKSENVNDFMNSYMVRKPGEKINLSEIIFNQLKKEAEYYYKVCDLIYSDPIG